MIYWKAPNTFKLIEIITYESGIWIKYMTVNDWNTRTSVDTEETANDLRRLGGT